MKKRKSIPQKTKALLQKEIYSKCPFCTNEDVDHFQIHHLNENPLDNDIFNLIMLCANCHSKITKGDILTEDVLMVKKQLITQSSELQLVNINIDHQNCSWSIDEDYEHVFHYERNGKSPFPILDFSFINNSQEVVILNKITLEVKSLFSGLNGVPQPSVLNPLVKYQIKIDYEKEINILKILDAIQCPPKQAFRFQVELSQKTSISNENFPPEGRKLLFFKFYFNNGVVVIAPTIKFNTIDESDTIPIVLLS